MYITVTKGPSPTIHHFDLTLIAQKGCTIPCLDWCVIDPFWGLKGSWIWLWTGGGKERETKKDKEKEKEKIYSPQRHDRYNTEKKLN